MAEDESIRAGRDGIAIRAAGLASARAQVAAARLRREQLIAGRRLHHPTRNSGLEVDQSNPILPGYTIVRRVHRGGQGVVYLARQESTGRLVAVKLLLHGALAAPSELARFQREVEVLSRLKHPNVVTIHDCGRADSGVFLVMDFVDGLRLDEYVRRNAEKSKSRKVEIERTLDLFAKVCDGVNAAHLRGIIHRDLKPSNILVVEEATEGTSRTGAPLRGSVASWLRGFPKILDFGLAKLTSESNEASSAASMTLTGQFLGSLPWASPEQAKGRTDQLDVRTDVYSLGVILYQLLTGEFPYPVDGRMDEVVRHIAQSAPARPSSVDRWVTGDVETILLKCLSKEPERRYQSAGELGRDIRHFLKGEAIAAKRDSLGYVLRKQLRRHRGLVVVSAVLGFSLLASSVVVWIMYVRAADAAVKAGISERQALRSEAEAKLSLGDAYLAEARALRTGREPGQRDQRLEVLGKAAALNDSVSELRKEIIAGLAETDFVVDQTIASPPDTHPYRTVVKAGKVAFGTHSGGILLRPRLDEPAGEYWIAPPEPDDEISILEFSPDGHHLMVRYQKRYSRNVRVRLWDLAERRWSWELPSAGDVSFVYCGFTPDVESITVAHPDHVTRFHRVCDGTVAREVKHGFPVRGMLHLRENGDRPRLMLADQSKPRLVAWDLEQASPSEFPLPVGALALAESHDGRWLAVSCFDKRVRIYRPRDDADGRLAITEGNTDAPFAIFSGHHALVEALAFSPDDALLFTQGQDDTVRVWDVARSVERFAPLRDVTIAGMDADRTAFLGKAGLSLRRLDPSPVCRTLRARWEHPTFIDDRKLAVGGAGLSIWDWRAGELEVTLTTDRVTGVHHSSAGLLASTLKNQLLLWPAPGNDQAQWGSPIVVWEGPKPILGMTVTPDDEVAFVADEDDRVWRVPLADPASAEIFVSQLGARPHDVSPDGRQLAVGHWRGHEAVVYSVPGGERRFSVETPGAFHALSGFVARARGEALLIVAAPNEYRSFDAESYVPRHTVPRRGWLAYYATSPDGRTALITRTGGLPVLIDLSNFEELAELTLPEPNCSLSRAAFDPSGSHLVLTTNDPTTFIWDLSAVRRHLSRLDLDWE